jgi:hypothetical protein
MTPEYQGCYHCGAPTSNIATFIDQQAPCHRRHVKAFREYIISFKGFCDIVAGSLGVPSDPRPQSAETGEFACVVYAERD